MLSDNKLKMAQVSPCLSGIRQTLFTIKQQQPVTGRANQTSGQRLVFQNIRNEKQRVNAAFRVRMMGVYRPSLGISPLSSLQSTPSNSLNTGPSKTNADSIGDPKSAPQIPDLVPKDS